MKTKLACGCEIGCGAGRTAQWRARRKHARTCAAYAAFRETQREQQREAIRAKAPPWQPGPPTLPKDIGDYDLPDYDEAMAEWEDDIRLAPSDSERRLIERDPPLKGVDYE